jgi:hypothetical protein
MATYLEQCNLLATFFYTEMPPFWTAFLECNLFPTPGVLQYEDNSTKHACGGGNDESITGQEKV